MVRWTRERIIQALVADAEERGEPPRAADWLRATDGHPHKDTVRSVFGSWRAGIEAAGLTYIYRGGRTDPWTAEEVIDRIHEWAELYADPPGLQDWQPSLALASGREEIAAYWHECWPHWPPANRVGQLFGRWNQAIEAAGYIPMPPGRRRSDPAGQSGQPVELWDRDGIVAALRRWHREYGRIPTVEEWARVDDPRWPSRTTASRICGSWAAAIRAAGLEPPLHDLVEWRKALEVIHRSPGLTCAEIAAEIGADQKRLADKLRYHYRRGVVSRGGTGGNADPYTYWPGSADSK